MELGVTEKFVVEGFERAIRTGIKELTGLLDSFNKLALVDWEAIVQDGDKKGSIVPLLPALEQLNSKLSKASLMLLLLLIMTEKE